MLATVICLFFFRLPAPFFFAPWLDEKTDNGSKKKKKTAAQQQQQQQQQQQLEKEQQKKTNDDRRIGACSLCDCFVSLYPPPRLLRVHLCVSVCVCSSTVRRHYTLLDDKTAAPTPLTHSRKKTPNKPNTKRKTMASVAANK